MQCSRSSRLVRAVLFVAASAVTLVTLATASSAHAGFKAYSAFGFAPNPAGGSNAVSGDQSTSPYAAGATVTMYMRSAVEVPNGQSWDPALYSNVDMKITVPSGWTNPTCGSANLQVNNGSTNSTNQPGPAVAGWQCEIYVSAGHSVIHSGGLRLLREVSRPTPPSTSCSRSPPRHPRSRRPTGWAAPRVSPQISSTRMARSRTGTRAPSTSALTPRVLLRRLRPVDSFVPWLLPSRRRPPLLLAR
jgi:hypothetical protein